MALNAPYTPNTVIQSTQVSNDLVGLANGSNDTANNAMSTYRGENVLDFVASGCVWSGDAYASTRAASQTSGVVYISGVRLTVAAVSARSFTASKDTYIDVNGSGVQVYTEVTNNAASPALTAGSIRIGIIITGATTIAAATSVNQGQESMVLPIASSIAYSVADSLGNLICCRDNNHKLLCLRQLTVQFTGTATSSTQITGLSCPVIVPTARKIKLSVEATFASSSANIPVTEIWDGVVASGTQIKQANTTVAGGSTPALATGVVITPTTATKTYNLGYRLSGAGTYTLDCGVVSPVQFKVELD